MNLAELIDLQRDLSELAFRQRNERDRDTMLKACSALFDCHRERERIKRAIG